MRNVIVGRWVFMTMLTMQLTSNETLKNPDFFQLRIVRVRHLSKPNILSMLFSRNQMKCITDMSNPSITLSSTSRTSTRWSPTGTLRDNDKGCLRRIRHVWEPSQWIPFEKLGIKLV